MAKYTVVTMPGDGIGNQVLPQALRMLEAVGFDAEYIHADIGWNCWCREGNALPQRTIDLLAKHRLGLFGAITSKPKKQAEAELASELPGKGYSYFSPIVTMRQKFGLDTCIRPCISFPGNPLNFVRKRPEGGFEEPFVNAVVFRQNTEGLYAGVEWSNPPEQVRAALATHPKFKPFAGSGNIGDEVAVFEPTHGSAPKYAELDPAIVSPIAMILSAVMMLELIGEIEKARLIRNAIAAVVKEGKVRTYAMMRIPGGQKTLAAGAASTIQMTDAILAKLGST